MNKILLLLTALLAACTITAPTPTPQSSAWGTVYTLGQAEQADAPSIWPFEDRVMATWIGADDTGIHQDSRTVVSGVESVLKDAPPGTPVILMTPQGRVFSHCIAKELAAYEQIVMVCGRYEGIDDRVRQLVITDEISIGDYVLTGGELPAMVIIDAVVRHIPGVLGAQWAADEDSHADGILEGPHYTRPPVFRALPVPAILQDGDHGKVAAWRRAQGLRHTWQNRPDLLLKAQLTDDEKYLLASFADEDSQTSP